MFEVMVWGGLLRFLQALTQGAPTLLAGLLVAGVFRRLLGPERTVRLFGGRSWRSLPQAWALGMLLPVCSLGVIPVILEMRRAGVKGGTILAFALSAPLFNPLSLLYGLTLSAPLHILAFAACSLVVVTVVGALWDRWFPDTSGGEAPPPPVAPGMKRLASIVVVAAREMAGGTVGYCGIALTGVVVLSVVLPVGSLQTTVNHGRPWAPLLMAGVAIPAYVTPMMAMSQLGQMFQHGNSVGAAFVLLALGAGTNLGLLAFMFHNYGFRRSAVWLALVVAVVVGIAYTIDKPLFPQGTIPEQHTHVFDVYCAPFHGTGDATAAEVWRQLHEHLAPFEMAGTVILAGLVLAGFALRRLDRHWRIEDWLQRTPVSVSHASAWHDRPLPTPVLGGAALLGLLALSVVGCFIYYPAPKESIEQMRVIKTEALTAALGGEEELAEHWIEVWDDWTRRLQVGVYLRQGGLSELQQREAKQLRDDLEMLEHSVDEDDRETVRQHAASVEATYLRLRAAYLAGS